MKEESTSNDTIARLCDAIRDKTGLLLQESIVRKLNNNLGAKMSPEILNVIVTQLTHGAADSPDFLSILENVINNETFFFVIKRNLTI